MLLSICIVWKILTLYLLYCSKTSDKYLLLISLIGQLFLLYGVIYKNNYIIEICHIIYWIAVICGTIIYKEKNNILFTLLNISLILLTRFYYKDCLFYMANNRTKLYEVTFEIHHICIFLILILLFKLYRLH